MKMLAMNLPTFFCLIEKCGTCTWSDCLLEFDDPLIIAVIFVVIENRLDIFNWCRCSSGDRYACIRKKLLPSVYYDIIQWFSKKSSLIVGYTDIMKLFRIIALFPTDHDQCIELIEIVHNDGLSFICRFAYIREFRQFCIRKSLSYIIQYILYMWKVQCCLR